MKNAYLRYLETAAKNKTAATVEVEAVEPTEQVITEVEVPAVVEAESAAAEDVTTKSKKKKKVHKEEA